MSYAITLTTINMPQVLENVIEDLLAHPVPETGQIVVIGDLKSPKENSDFCSRIDKKGVDVTIEYWDVDSQDDYFKSKYKNLYEHIPVNSFARRNFADLISLENKHQYTIRIDDDNYPIEGHPFVSGHRAAMKAHTLNVIETKSGWFNICQTLESDGSEAYYPRGFPYEARWIPEEANITTQDNLQVGVNAGLWLGDPDIDAITRLHKPINAKRYDEKRYGNTFALSSKTNCPINTQNTCYLNSVLSVAYVSPFAGRYDDIISGYVVNQLRESHDFYVTYGNPLLFQSRNEHNLWNDLRLELPGNECISTLLDLMSEPNLASEDIVENYLIIVNHILANETKYDAFLRPIFEGMRIWAEDIKTAEIC